MNVTSPIAEALSQVNYTYDNVNQLMSATKTVQSNSNESFTYDNLGNRLKKNNQSTNNVYDNNNRIVSDDVYNYTHDDNGNMIKKVKRSTGYTTRYIWDFENKLQFIKEYTTEADTTPIKTHTFLYDVYGRRIVKDSDGVVHKYVYDNEDILFEFDNNDNLVSSFSHGPGIDEPVEIIQNNQNYYYHVDGLGSVTGISNTNGEIVQSYAYSSFGETKVYDQAGTLIDPTQMQVKSPYGYTSREWDFETEKYQYRTRDYIPALGRFLTEDPIRFKGGDTNLYRYVGNNPLNFVDPLGLEITAPVISATQFKDFISTSSGKAAIDRKFSAPSDQQYRFVQVDKQVVDMRHASAAYTQTVTLMEYGVPSAIAGAITYGLGIGVEIDQLSGGRISNVLSNQSFANTQPSLGDNHSAFSSEDIPSNVFGIEAAKSGLGLGGLCDK